MKKTLECDILVVGGGVAGTAAAYSAAQQGAHVILLEKYGFLGGLAASAWVGTICGAYLPCVGEKTFRFGVGHFPATFVESLQRKYKESPHVSKRGLVFLPCTPQNIATTLQELLELPSVSVLTHTTLHGVMKSGQMIHSIQALCYNIATIIKPKAIIDTSGESIVSLLGNYPTQQHDDSQAASLSLCIQGISTETSQDESLSQEVSLLVLRAQMGVTASILPGGLSRNPVVIKISSGTTPNGAMEVIQEEQSLRSKSDEVFHLLQQNLPAFKNAYLSELTPQLGIRRGLMPEGQALLTDEAVIQAQKNPLGVARGCWPIEQWLEKGSVQIIPLKDDHWYDIPAGSLHSKWCANLFFAGRAFSADPSAIASARVIGTALGTGYASGRMAVGYMNKQTETETVHEIRREQFG